MAAVDQDRELDRARTPKLEQCLHRGPGGSAVMDDVVDQHDGSVGKVGNVRRPAGQPGSIVVAMARGVDRAGGDLYAFQLGQLGGNPARQHITLRDDAGHDQIGGAPVALHDLVSDPGKGAADGVGIHDVRLDAPFWSHITKRSLRYRSLRGLDHDSTRSSSAIRTWTPLRAWRKY